MGDRGDNLAVDLIHLYPLQNAVPHKTDRFDLVREIENPTVILRRGLKFTMAINFTGRKFDKSKDLIRVVFNFGRSPNITKGTKGTMKVETKPKPDDYKNWYASILAERGDSLTIEVFSPADIPVGVWKLQIETSVENSNKKPTVYEYGHDIYILFNPWSCQDLVYMPEERLLQEYILEDIGKVWVGPYGSSRGRQWVFGQFEECVLPAIMLMFERAYLPDQSRGDPIKVTRIISKLVNSNDDDGILAGRWDGDYSDGTAPAAWTGTEAILQKFLDTKQPVNYGQCWVFSSVVCTICRALGIPCRTVSNLVSAHDANSSLTIDKYYNEKNEEMEYDPKNPTGEDSIWNYHVWNDVWMARPDLPKGYGGWQAIDATPQETSSGFFQCGPASLVAVKAGAVGYNYDVSFVIASVNADVMRWKEDSKSPLGYTKIYSNKYHIGRTILTKKPFVFDQNGDRDRQDITDDYKSREGSDAERVALYNAVRGSSLAKSFYDLPSALEEDVEFDLIELDRINLGESFSVTVNIENKSSEVRSVRAMLQAESVYYTGVKANIVKKAEGEFKLKPKSKETLRLVVKDIEYMDKLVEYCNMKLCAIASVEETRQTWADEDDFQVLKPALQLKVPDEVEVGKLVPIIMSFTNPLKTTLKKCVFNIAGPTLTKNQAYKYSDVKAGALVKVEAKIIPKVPGMHKLVATFSSVDLVDITGTAEVQVKQ